MRVRVRLFAMLRERAGRSLVELELADGSTAGDVWPALALGPEPDGLAVAVNRAYADRATALREGDEVAFIPPVSGGAAPRLAVELVREPIDLGALVAAVEDDGAGAIATFSGTVRDRSREQDVRHLDYEAFDEMAVLEMRRIAAAAADRHGLIAVAVAHRSGVLAIGEVSVAIACSAAHRAPALTACQEIIDELKERVPIWKKEHYADGSQWIGRGS